MKPQDHQQYTEIDYQHLSGKGYTDAEILEIWDRDAARGADPVTHYPEPFDIVGYLNQ